jgi:hypothetical protein
MKNLLVKGVGCPHISPLSPGWGGEERNFRKALQHCHRWIVQEIFWCYSDIQVLSQNCRNDRKLGNR